jgi:hypothetical protein
MLQKVCVGKSIILFAVEKKSSRTFNLYWWEERKVIKAYDEMKPKIMFLKSIKRFFEHTANRSSPWVSKPHFSRVATQRLLRGIYLLKMKTS